jgi:hypothetical protein
MRRGGRNNMGDFRASIKIEMELMGKKYKNEWGWINYFDNGEGIDQRIVDWFNECWGDTQGRYDDIIYKSGEEDRKREEKELYERLKEKYDQSKH